MQIVQAKEKNTSY